MVKLPSDVKKVIGKIKSSKRTTPLWEGPESNGRNGGVTQSLISRWLICKERLRLLLQEGLAPADEFMHRIEYGNFFHICEEYHAKGPDPTNKNIRNWEAPLEKYCKDLCKKYPLQQEQIIHWMTVCKIQFPIYVEFWKKNKEVIQRTPLFQEYEFRIPYRLPSGREVYLRGKWDGVDLIGKGKKSGIYLQENKTKGEVNETQIRRQLSYDIQVMFYMTALQVWDDDNTNQGVFAGEAAGVGFDVGRGASLKGCRFNVIRRPLSGGKGTIVRHKATKNKPEETKEDYYKRLEEVIKENQDNFFMRWTIDISHQDIENFKRKSLTPILESLCDWWTLISENKDPYDYDSVKLRPVYHYIMPFGIQSPLIDGGGTDLDECVLTGSTIGLRQVDTVFPELKGE